MLEQNHQSSAIAIMVPLPATWNLKIGHPREIFCSISLKYIIINCKYNTQCFPKHDTFTSFFPDYPLSSSSNSEPLTRAKTVNLEETNPHICKAKRCLFWIITVIFFMHWILDSSGLGMVEMLNRLMLTPPSEPICLDPDLTMNLDLSWGWGSPSRARKSCTAYCFHPRFSVLFEPYHFLT